MRRASVRTLRRIISHMPRRCSGMSDCPSSAVTAASTGVSGVRSSWLRAAMNWSFAWLATRAAFSASSRRWVSTAACLSLAQVDDDRRVEPQPRSDAPAPELHRCRIVQVELAGERVPFGWTSLEVRREHLVIRPAHQSFEPCPTRG